MPMMKPTGPESDELLTRSDVARLLGVSPTTVTRWAREGRLACQITLGGHHRFRSGLIEEIRTRMSHESSEDAKAGHELAGVRS
jgi:excisionase family DNA binding protein